ncbi:MAG: hypothetical protein ACOYVF_02150 [Candidatus Zixiibacteriota bacterium]
MLKLLGWLWPVLLLVGCASMATKNAFYKPITAELQSGNISTAAAMLEQAREDDKIARKDRLLYYIDAGLLQHYAGHYDTSNQRLHEAEQAAEELFTKSISRAALSLLLNDNALEYAGEDYEVLYTNLIKALNYVSLNDFDGAFVEIRRANLKLELLQQKYAGAAEQLQYGNPDDSDRVELPYEVDEIDFHNDAFARYMSMHMYAAEGKFDDARIDYDYLREAFRTQAHIYDFPLPVVKYYSDSAAVLSVVSLVGLAPVKEALNLRVRSDKDLNLIQVLYDSPGMENAEYGHIPYKVTEDFYFKFAIPQLVARPSVISRIRVLADGVALGELQLLESLNKVAEETFAAKKSLIYIRSVARAVTKSLAAFKMKKKADTGGLGGWLKKVAIDVGTDLTENADLRCSQYLPESIYVGDFDVEPGTYDLAVEYYDLNGTLVTKKYYPAVKVVEGGFNLVETFSLN